MSETERRAILAAECGVFCRYLVERDAPPEVLAAYQRAHEHGTVEAGVIATPLDHALLRIARTAPSVARTADAYASLFAGSSLLRRKLVLLLAILESRGPTAAALDTAGRGSGVLWVAQLGAHSCGWLMRVFMAAPLVVSLWIWYGLIDRLWIWHGLIDRRAQDPR
jgi:hypothetical protein